MTTALQDHRVLSRRRYTRKGWTTIVVDAAEEKADRLEPVHEDVTWPAATTKPTLRDGCWLDGTWPIAGPDARWWGRALHYEIGRQAVIAMAVENRRLPERTAA